MKLFRIILCVLAVALGIPAPANITSTTNRAGPYTCTGLPATLSVVFPYQQASDLLVVDLGQAGTSIDPPAILTLNSDYTVTGGGYNATTNMQSGNVVVVTGGAHNVQVNDVVAILRNVPVNQLTSFVTGILTAATIEKAFDKQATLSQQLTEASGRSLRFETGETLDGTLVRSSRVGKLLGFDANGAISYYAVGSGGGGGGSYIAGTGLILSGNTFSVNPVQTLTSLTTTTLAWTTAAGLRTSKANAHLTINVKDYGAVGDGSVDDTTAINSAIAALTNYSTLFFPAGNYKITNSLTGFTGLSYVRVLGEGARIISTVTGAAPNTFVADSTCSHIDFQNLAIVGSASVRGSGIHIRLYSSFSSVTNCFFSGCSDFAIHLSNDGGGYNTGSRIENNTITGTLGDGIHVGSASDFNIVGNTITATGDDAIGLVADNTPTPPIRGTVVGNHIYNSASAGIRVDEVSDLLVEANDINTTAGAGIDINRYLSTTAYNNRINIKGNRLYNTTTTPGPRGSIWINFSTDSSVTNNAVYSPVNGGGIVFLDFSDLVISGNTVKGAPSRGIASDDTTTTNVATNWNNLTIANNVLDSVTANQAIYAVPAVGKAINNLVITGNTGNALPSGDWLYYTRANTVLVANNSSRDNRTVGNGGTITSATEYNNTFWQKLGIGIAPSTTSDLIVVHSVPAATASASILVQGGLAAPASTDLHPNAFRDATVYTSTVAADAYASFDAQSSLAGTLDYNHGIGFQARNSFGGSGTLGRLEGFSAFMGVSSGTVTFARAFYVPDLTVTGGSVGEYDGLYIDQLSAGTTRHAIYAAGNDPWFSAGGQIYTSALLTTPAGDATMRMGATFDQATQTGMGVMNKSATATGRMVGFFNSGGTLQGSISQTNSTTIAYNTSSDIRLKENVRDITDSGAILDHLQPRVFDWRNGGQKNIYGFIAQEMVGVYPQAVHVGGADVTKDPWMIEKADLVPVLAAETKSLRTRVASLESNQRYLWAGMLATVLLSVTVTEIRRRR